MLELLVSHSQVLAGRLALGPSAALIDDLNALANRLPAAAKPSERLLICGLVGHVVGRLIYSTGLGNRPDIANAFMAWAASKPTSDQWRPELVDLIKCCSLALVNLTAPRTAATEDARVSCGLRLIDLRFKEPSFSRRDLATEMSLSVWHAARLLRSSTGLNFYAHVHNRRVDAAETLLKETRLSVKEVAAAVGYTSSNQLGRHFKRLRGVTAVTYRRRASVANSAT
jgi:AraC-like DNA-binding protein